MAITRCIGFHFQKMSAIQPQHFVELFIRVQKKNILKFLFYWIKFSNDVKFIEFTVKRTDNVIAYNDNTYEYEIRITENEGILKVMPIIIL